MLQASKRTRTIKTAESAIPLPKARVEALTKTTKLNFIKLGRKVTKSKRKEMHSFMCGSRSFCSGQGKHVVLSEYPCTVIFILSVSLMLREACSINNV